MYTLINLSAAELMLCLFEKLGPLLERPLNTHPIKGNNKRKYLLKSKSKQIKK